MKNHINTLRRSDVPGIYLNGANEQVTLPYRPDKSTINRSKYKANGARK